MKLHGKYFDFTLPDVGDGPSVERAPDAGRRCRAIPRIDREFEETMERPGFEGQVQPSSDLCRMSGRWGNCTTAGRLLRTPS